MIADYYKEQLHAKEEMLAQTTRFLVNTQNLLEEKNRSLHAVNQNIFDSIQFASIIQKSLLPDVNILKVFFKDAGYRVMQQIGIGGDTVFVKNTNNGLLFGLFDSTGHGIPAALLSISGTVILRELIYAMEINCPQRLLQLLNQQMYNVFNAAGAYKIAHMEGLIFHYTSAENKLTYCSARGKALHLKRTGEVVALAGSKRSIGEELDAAFPLFEMIAAPGDKLMIYSDGLQDQFGGAANRKFSVSRLRTLLETHGRQTASRLAEIVEDEFLNWKGENEQTDDTSFMIIDF